MRGNLIAAVHPMASAVLHSKKKEKKRQATKTFGPHAFVSASNYHLVWPVFSGISVDSTRSPLLPNHRPGQMIGK